MQAWQAVAGSRVFRDFEIQKILGSGGFGVVLRVQHRIDQKKYAIKLNIYSDSHTANKVQNFARIPAHENVVGYYTSWMDTITMAEMRSLERIGFSANELGIPRGTQQMQLLCIQMELCGQDLRHWLRQQTTVNENKCKKIFQQILKGLQHIHNQGLIHRDLKPDNIFFAMNNSDNVKIGDFGIAAVHGGTAGARHTRGFGTILYLAPEQYTRTYGRKADLYAMGLILFEIYHPPAQRDLEQSLTQLKNLKTLPREFRSWPEVSKTILSLIDYEPEKRPTIEQLLSKRNAAASDMTDMAQIERFFGSMALGRSRAYKPETMWRQDDTDIAEHDIICDGCQQHPIFGTRYKCKSCDDFDYCSDCYKSESSHRRKHDFTIIHKPIAKCTIDYDRDTVLHHHVRCNGCRERPIKGRRYKCQSCDDFDFCRNCYVSEASHREKHEFSLIKQCKKHGGTCKDDEGDQLDFNRVEISVLHHGVRCNGCKETPIEGIRYNCKSCDFFDFCETCYDSSTSHAIRHEFRRLTKFVVHAATCDGCQRTIRGTRHTCKKCPDFDYCYKCYYKNESHRDSHRFHTYYN